MATQTVEHDGVTVEIGKLSYGGRLQRSALLRKFAPAPSEDADEDTKERDVALGNYIFLTAQLVAIHGATLHVPTPEDTPEQFEAGFQQFLALDNDFISKWVRAFNALSSSGNDANAKPAAELTAEEQSSPS